MLFNSLQFLYAFLPITYLVFWRLTGKMPRYVWLAISGYVFYSFWNYKFCALMLFSTAVSYLAGRALLRWHDPGRRRLCVIVPVVMDLALLGFFKYGNFAVTNINTVVSWVGGTSTLPILNIILPVGISFYTFHTITYIIDSYRGVITPTRNFFKFAAYVSLFSQLVAGPIVRFRQIDQDFENIDRADRTADLHTGWSFFVIGFLEKVLIADTIAAVIDPALVRYAELSTVSAWLCVLGFAYQVYFDFAGYSDMAVGLGYMFGFRLPQNFNSPYKATDIADLWLVGLAIFRASGFEMAFALLDKMFTWQAGTSFIGAGVLIVMLVIAAVIAHWAPNTFEIRHRWSPSWVASFAVLFGIGLFVLYGSRPAPYIYFQF